MKLFYELVGSLYRQEKFDNFPLNFLKLGDHSFMIVYVIIRSSLLPMWHILLQLIHSIRDSISKACETYLITRGNTLQPLCLNEKKKCNVSFYYILKLSNILFLRKGGNDGKCIHEYCNAVVSDDWVGSTRTSFQIHLARVL